MTCLGGGLAGDCGRWSRFGRMSRHWNEQRSAPLPTLKHAVSKGSILEMCQHVDPRRRARSLSDEFIQKTYEERYATKAKGD